LCSSLSRTQILNRHIVRHDGAARREAIGRTSAWRVQTGSIGKCIERTRHRNAVQLHGNVCDICDVTRTAQPYFGSVERVGARTFSLSSLISACAYAARRSEGSERTRALNAKSRGIFLSELILAYTAPGERFSFLAIRPTLILEAMSLRSWTSSAGVQGRPAGRGPTIEISQLKRLSNRIKHAVARRGNRGEIASGVARAGACCSQVCSKYGLTLRSYRI